MASLREQILAAQDLPSKAVAVPEWGLEVFVRTMTGTERDQYEQEIIAAHRPDGKFNVVDVRARLVVFCAVDAEGKRVFTNEDIGAVGGKNALALDRVFAVASELNGIGQKEIDELGKASAVAGAASTSSSPSA